jgi:hypothetical protein
MGGSTITEVNRDALIQRIFSTAATSHPDQMKAMMHGVAKAIGGPAITIGHRNALINRILGAAV